MATYVYKKGKTKNLKKYYRSIGAVLISGGLMVVLYFFFPVVSYQIFLGSASAQGAIESPVPKYMLASKSNLGSLIKEGIRSLTTDYTDARNWYPTVAGDIKKVKVDIYSLSIPKLKIENAEVSTIDYDLNRHLVHYSGTSIPGEKGTAVIFGHSTLPQWFDPKNYKTIFATVHTLKIGDEIRATVNNTVYQYKVYSMIITTPEDTEIFSQLYDNSYITIVTCTPPGTTWKRLIVRARLEKIL